MVSRYVEVSKVNCFECGCEMFDSIDSDPDGQQNATCAKCRAEQSHDFDLEPAAMFDRSGRRIDQ